MTSMTNSEAPISEDRRPVRRGDAVRFLPVGGRYRISIVVEAVMETSLGTVLFHGRRLNREGSVDSQSTSRAWVVDENSHVVITESDD